MSVQLETCLPCKVAGHSYVGVLTQDLCLTRKKSLCLKQRRMLLDAKPQEDHPVLER